jgi:hypothetical protein
MLTFDFMWRMFPSMNAYRTQHFTLFILQIGAWTYLIRRLWSFKHIEKSKKTTWTCLMIFFFSQFTTLYYIWTKDDELMLENKKITDTNDQAET